MNRLQSTEGFSLLEMLVVLAMISLVAGIVFNGLAWNKPRVNLSVLGQNIIHAAASASLRAVSKGETNRIEVDVINRRITTGSDIDDIIIPASFNIYVRTGAELIEQRSRAAIEFYSDGTSSGGEITVADQKGNRRSVRIYWLTGAITSDNGAGP